ncbi:Uncharacterised protein [uncultured archaeon]|nr:Uncharacterised protein [uncultured archaeon]
MAKKAKTTKRRMSDEEYWEEWGERFGKKMEKKGEAFGKRLEARFEKKGKHFEKDCKWHCSPLGVIGPLAGSIVGIVVLIIIVAIVNWLNLGLGSTFLSALTGFVMNNLPWFFAAGLIFNYAKYISRLMGHFKHFFRPVITSAAIAFVAWLIGAVFMAVNVSAQDPFIASVSYSLSTHVLEIFLVFLVLGYAFLIIGHFLRMWMEK